MEEKVITQKKRGKQIDKVYLRVTYDMGWSKRSSGTRHDSKTGHAFIVGALAQKLIGMKVLSKEYRFCKAAQLTMKLVQWNNFLHN